MPIPGLGRRCGWGQRRRQSRRFAEISKFESLESRRLLSVSPLSYAIADAADHALALSLVQVNSTTTVQLSDNGVVVAQQALASTSLVSVTGAAGHDVLTVDFAGGSPVPSGGLTFTGGGSTNSLILQNGSFSSESYSALSATSGSIAFGSATVNFSGIGGILDTTNASSLLFTATGAQQQINLVNGPNSGSSHTTELNGGGLVPMDFANKSNVTINAGTGDDTVVLNNSAAATGLGSLTLDTWSGSDTVNVLSTPAGTSTQITSTAFFADGPDEVTVGNAGSVQAIQGTLDVSDDALFNDLTIDDSADTAGRTATLSRGSISGLAPATITWSVFDMGTLTVNGGSGGNTFNVFETVLSTVSNLNTGAGNDTVNVQCVLGGSAINVNGQGGNDNVNVFFSVLDSSHGSSLAGFSSILGAINVSNATGATNLTLDTTSESSAQTVTIGNRFASVATSVPKGPTNSTVHFNLGSGGALIVKTGPAADTFVVTPSSTVLELDAGDPSVAPGDALNVNFGAVVNPTLGSSSVSGYDHAYNFANAATINFVHFESFTPAPPPVVSNADLALNFVGPASVNENGTITYTFSITNNGPSDATGTLLSDSFPASEFFQFASIGTASVSGGTLMLNLGTIANGSSIVGTLTFLAADEGNFVVNSAGVSSSVADSMQGNNSVMVTTSIVDPSVILSGGLTLSSVENSSFNGTIATFTDPAGNEPLSDYSATITWGDGSTSTGTITLNSSGQFVVSASHTYVEDGTYVAMVTVHHDSASDVSVQDTANVSDPAVVVTPVAPLSSVEGSFSNFTLATFTDPAGAEAIGNYQATINWGDGTTSAGTITAGTMPGTFVVSGGHSFVEDGTFHPTVSVSHGTAPAGTATDTLNVSDPNIVVTGGLSLDVQRSSTTPITVATFTDPAGAETSGNYAATIDWGDGVSSTGTISYNPSTGTFSATGVHAYTKSGKFTISVSLMHHGLPAVSVTDAAKVTGATPPPPPPPPTKSPILLVSRAMDKHGLSDQLKGKQPLPPAKPKPTPFSTHRIVPHKGKA